jgi:hypothetical protein
MKRNTITVLIVLLSISILFATLLTLPRVGIAQPDPYFHVKITPVIYWIGFSLAIFVTLGIVFSKKEGSGRYGLGLFSVMLLSIYVYDIPRLFYANPIYTDTYIFVGEMLFTLRYGHLGFGHALETPGLAVFSSQFSMITGVNYVAIAEAILFIIPLASIFAVYLIAKMLVSKRVALLACLFFMAINWWGFSFNRQSFAFMFSLYVSYFTFTSLLRRDGSLPWYVMAMLSFFVLVVLHPISSLLLIITVLAIAVFTYLLFLIRRPSLEGKASLARNLPIRATSIAIIFSIMWLSWNIYTRTNLQQAISTIDEAVGWLFGGLNPLQRAGELVGGYTGVYLPIVNLRYAEMIFEGIVGTALAIITLIKINSYPKNIILSSWVFGSMSIAVFGFYGNWLQLLYRPFLHALPGFSILMAWAILSRKNLAKNKGFSKEILKVAKGLIVSAMLLFLLCTPLTMYSQAPFMYPPNAYFAESNRIAQIANGTIATFGFSSVFGYSQLVNNASYAAAVPYDPLNQSQYRTIITDYIGYAKDAFFVNVPSNTYSYNALETEFAQNPGFAKVYDADAWDRAYVNQTIAYARP